MIRRCAIVTVLLVTAACGGPPPTPEALREGLVARWTFDEGRGTTADDDSNHHNTATLHGGTWAPGLDGSALAMDGGNDDIVTVAASESLEHTRRHITVSAWARRSALHNVALVSHGYPQLFFGFHGTQYKWQVRNRWGHVAACYADPRYQAGPDRWLHVAGTYDGLAVRLYANGEPICRRWQIGAIDASEAPWTLSGYRNRDGAIVDEMSGLIDDVRIYDRALSAVEVHALFELGAPQGPDGPG